MKPMQLHADSYRCTATVEVEALGHDDRGLLLYGLRCDRENIFYPGGGGQPADLGTLGGVTVAHVSNESGRLVFTLARRISPGRQIMMIDCRHRRDKMVQHTTQHLISGLVENVSARQTIAYAMNKGRLDLDGPVSDRDVDRISALANEAIRNARTVLTVVEGEHRRVAIDGLPSVACAGTHVKRLSEVQVVIVRQESDTRIAFLSGDRALSAAASWGMTINTIRRLLSCKDSVADAVASLVANYGSLRSTTKRADKVHAEAMAQAILRGPNRELIELPGLDKAFLAHVAHVLAQETDAIVVLASEGDNAIVHWVGVGLRSAPAVATRRPMIATPTGVFIGQTDKASWAAVKNQLATAAKRV